MTEQEKQKLIKWLEEGIACSEEYGFSGNILNSMQIALASLTAPPVKLPKIKYPAQFDYADEVIEVLKSHGYEVEE